jgi:PAS domain S-box-containing protein
MVHSNGHLIRILVIDDDEDDFFITSEYIKQIGDSHFQIDWCYRYNDALELIRKRQHDLYFVDYYMGARTGLQLIKEANTQEIEAPMILLTGKGTRTIDQEAMQAGATDYLVKTELNAEKLERSIRYAIERSNSLKALRANERKYRSMFERSKDAVFLLGPELEFRDVNEATSQLFRCPKKELLSNSLLNLVDENEKSYIATQIKVSGEVNDRELEVITTDGERKTCILSLSTQTDTQGAYFLHGLLHDITHIKKAEKAALQAEKLAAAGRLVQTLAHEVRNPLNNINLAVEQLDYTLDSENENKLYMDIIRRNSKRIGDIITELVNSARPAEMFMERKSLQEIMDDSISAALDRITLQRVKLQVRYADQPAYIFADPQKMKIAFLNIIINAVEAMEEEKGELTIIISTDSRRHTVHINDNGSGISEENLSRLFEPYFTSKRNGLGLGLAATLNILQSHKAHIDVSSALNKGTFFTITFPAHVTTSVQ